MLANLDIAGLEDEVDGDVQVAGEALEDMICQETQGGDAADGEARPAKAQRSPF